MAVRARRAGIPTAATEAWILVAVIPRIVSLSARWRVLFDQAGSDCDDDVGIVCKPRKAATRDVAPLPDVRRWSRVRDAKRSGPALSTHSHTGWTNKRGTVILPLLLSSGPGVRFTGLSRIHALLRGFGVTPPNPI